jgi:NAD(P) transhydrogenase subunit alpha
MRWKSSLCGSLVLALWATQVLPVYAQTQPAKIQPSRPPTTQAQPGPHTRAAAPVKSSAHTPPAASPVKEALPPAATKAASASPEPGLDYMSMLFVFMLATFIGVGVIMRVSRLLHTPLMSLTNAISAIAVVGSLMLAGGKDYPTAYKIAGAVAMFASMTNIISGFLITDRMLKMFKTRKGGQA